MREKKVDSSKIADATKNRRLLNNEPLSVETFSNYIEHTWWIIQV
jgi:hypothetical protein